MISRALALIGVFSVAACAAAAPPLDLSPTTKADDQWAPPVVRSEAAPLAPALGEPIELAKLVEDRLRTALIAGDTRLMDDAANRALRADRAGDRQAAVLRALLTITSARLEVVATAPSGDPS